MVFKNKMSKRTRSIVTVTATLAVASTGIGYAYWSTQGSVNGSALTAANSSTSFTVTLGSQSGPLEPGGVVTVPITIDNPGSTSLKASTVTVVMEDASHTPLSGLVPVGCDATDYAASGVVTGGPQLIAGGASAPGVVTLTLTNTGTDQNACKGFSVPLSVSVS